MEDAGGLEGNKSATEFESSASELGKSFPCQVEQVATNREGCISGSGSSAGGSIKLPNSTAEASQSRTSAKEKQWPPGNWTRDALIELLVRLLSTKPIDSSHGLLGMEEARKHAKKIEKKSFAIADKYSKEKNDDGISAISLYRKTASQMRSELQKTIPRGNTKMERLVDESFLLWRTFFDKPTRAIPSDEEFKTKPLFCPLPGLGSSQERISLINRSLGTTDETAAAPNSTAEASQSRTSAKEKQWPQYSKEKNDDGISITSLYTNTASELRSELQKTVPRGNTKIERLADEHSLLRGTFFDRPTRDIPSVEEFKTKPLFCPFPGLGRSQKRICLSNRSFGTTDETAAAPICPKEPGLRDNLFAIDAGMTHSETIGKLPDPVGCYHSNLSLESTGTMAIESSTQLVAPMPRNEITDKAAPAFGEFLTESKLPKKQSETENDLDDGGALVSAKTLERSGTDHLNTDMLQRVGAWYLKNASMKEAAFVQSTHKMSNESLVELKKILKDDTNLLAMLGLLVENEPEGGVRDNTEEVEDEHEGEARDNAEEVEDEPEGEARVYGADEDDAMDVDSGLQNL